jgi:hypothetical protein
MTAVRNKWIIFAGLVCSFTLTLWLWACIVNLFRKATKCIRELTTVMHYVVFSLHAKESIVFGTSQPRDLDVAYLSYVSSERLAVASTLVIS